MGMLISYAVCILTILGWEGNSIPMTVSSTLSDEKTNGIILASMLSMGFFTILYERERKDIVSFVSMLFILIGIYGVILIEETEPIHYIFASTVFISIMAFMFRNTTSIYLFLLCILNFVLMLFLFGCILSIIHDHTLFLISEIGFIGIFAIFYLFLHFYT